jgi:hypothetical protein
MLGGSRTYYLISNTAATLTTTSADKEEARIALIKVGSVKGIRERNLRGWYQRSHREATQLESVRVKTRVGTEKRLTKNG